MTPVTLTKRGGGRIVVNADAVTYLEDFHGDTTIYFDHAVDAGQRRVTASLQVQGDIATTALLFAQARS